jgi:general secretion pathway protein D
MRRYPGRLGFITMLLLMVGTATGQPPAPSHITPSFKDADFVNVVQAVSVATGKSFIIDRRVRARVTMLTATAMSPAAFYDAFLSLLPICGLVAREDGNIVKILPATKAPTPMLIRVGLSDFSGVSCVQQ